MHVMLDLETLGTKPGCVVLSIGAVAFDLDGTVRGEFYRNIDPDDCLSLGLTVERATVQWWGRQSAAARARLETDRVPLAAAVADFARFFIAQGARRVWCQGATFDAPIWEAACLAVGRRAPWHFSEVRDTRTVYDICSFDPRSIAFSGTAHDALADARHQVACVAAALRPVLPRDLVTHLHRQRDFSARTFGPGARTRGVLDHIRKELAEIERAPDSLDEWIDIVLLAFDGAWRAGHEPAAIARALIDTQARNEARLWPDWREADPDKAIEHVRTGDLPPAKGVAAAC